MRAEIERQYDKRRDIPIEKGCPLNDILQIRIATERDLPNLLPLFGQLGMDDGRVLRAGEAEQIFRRMMTYPDYRLYVADFEGIVVGVFALLIMDNLGHLGAPSAVIEDVIVQSNWRGRGIGRRMMACAMELARAKRCYKLVLSSNRHRDEAHRFYKSIGFERHGYSFLVEVEANEAHRP
jgi:ribosomal protein S18 acetylase RimI-like enzyme